MVLRNADDGYNSSANGREVQMKIILGILLIVLMVCMIVVTFAVSSYFITETTLELKREREWLNDKTDKG